MRRPVIAFVVAAAALAACTRPVNMPQQTPPDVVVDYVPEQEILTALPLRVQLPAHYHAQRILVFFNTWGTRGWGVTELSRAGESWSGEISCRDISTVTGDTRYFFVAADDRGEVVLTSGSREWPHVATVVRTLPEGARALPGEKAVKCHDVADCPPDFPGCPAYASRRPACNSDRECDHGLACSWDHYCELPKGNTLEVDPSLSDEQLLKHAVDDAMRKYAKH